MTISNESVEAIRQAMAKGAYQMAPGELPYASAARRVAEAAAPIIRAELLNGLAAESQERSDTFMKTMKHMADSREYSADDVLRYGAYAAEANTAAYKLRARAAAERGGS